MRDVYWSHFVYVGCLPAPVDISKRNEAVPDAYAAGVIMNIRGAYSCPSIDMFHGHEVAPYSEPVPASLEPMQVVPGGAWTYAANSTDTLPCGRVK